MRFLHCDSIPPDNGATRFVTKFLGLPKTLPKGPLGAVETRWMETAIIEQRFEARACNTKFGRRVRDAWYDVSWAPDPRPK